MRKEIPSGHRSHQRMCQTLVESHFPICLPFPFDLSAKSVSFGCVSFCIQQKSWESNASMIKLVYIMIWIHCVFKFDIMHCVSACTDSIRWAIWSQRNGCFAPKVITISTLNAILWKKWSVILYGLFSILPFSPDMSTLTSDLPTLLGVSTGIAVLAGLICLVLHLFSKTKYPRHRHFNDNNLPPPIMYSSDTGNSNSSTKTIQLNRKKKHYEYIQSVNGNNANCCQFIQAGHRHVRAFVQAIHSVRMAIVGHQVHRIRTRLAAAKAS